MSILKYSDLNQNEFQGVLVVSSTKQVSTSDWIQRIIENALNKSSFGFEPDNENIPHILCFDNEKSSTVPNIKCHRVMLNNKYYSAQIYLVSLDEIVHFPDSFCSLIHGVVIYFDNNDPNGLIDSERWIQYIEQSMENCAIRILCCENATDANVICRVDIQKFCIDKCFELVELELKDSESLDEDDLEDDFQESNSFERIYRALQAYIWPNLHYKEEIRYGGQTSCPITSSLISKEIVQKMNGFSIGKDLSEETENGKEEEDSSIFSSTNSEDFFKYEKLDETKKQNDKIQSSNDQNRQVSESDVAEFENLFSQLSEMKEKSLKLNDKDRRQYAEKIAMAFWSSINNDKEEIRFNDDDDDQKEQNNKS